MEPAYWSVPTRTALGGALLRAGRAEDAEKVFREDLDQWPRNIWGLFGLQQSLQAQSKTQSSEIVQRQLEPLSKRADVKLDLAWY
jgi:hypothetical protein